MLSNGYHLTIIEDQAVPLASAPPTDDYFGYILLAVAIVAILLIGLLYGLWIRDHKKRIERLKSGLNQYGNDTMQECTVTVMHPRRIIETEKQLEQKLAGYYVTEAADSSY